VKRPKGFTLIELCVVLGIIAILAVTAALYGRHWASQYRLSNFMRATEGGIRMARMQAITQGRDCALIVSSNSLDTNFLLTTSAFAGDYVALGPHTMFLADTDTDWKKYFYYKAPLSNENYNYDFTDHKETMVYYLLYNSSLYSVTDTSTDVLGTYDRPTTDSFNIKFNSRGFPWIYVDTSPQAYVGRSILVQSNAFKASKGLTVTVSPTGKVE
jgi:prepilin-type N-terminal cleavage/methylation domain-containing protein